MVVIAESLKSTAVKYDQPNLLLTKIATANHSNSLSVTVIRHGVFLSCCNILIVFSLLVFSRFSRSLETPAQANLSTRIRRGGKW